MKIFQPFLTLMLSVDLTAQSQNHNLVVQANKINGPIQSTMYGLFFEDINYAADGGMYAELVKNRSFEFPQNFMGWVTYGNVKLMDDGPFERNPHYIRLGNPGHREKWTGVENEGFFGIGIKKDNDYRFSVWARGENQKIRVELIKNNSMEESQVVVQQELEINTTEWKQYEVILHSPATEPKAHLRIFMLSREGTLDLEHISLFPVDTWKNRKNGLRKDLVQVLYDMHPGVLRFPGGCIVEGTDFNTRYQWKNTIGQVENRPLNENRWHYTFPHRFFPDYFQSYGLGFFEFFQLAEDIGAAPLPILNVGLICQYQNEESAQPTINQIQPFIQDALDLIEFANGDTNTKWGRFRAEMGHEAPFNLKYLGIGNEQWGKIYPEHLKPFIEAVRKSYPEIKIIGSSGPGSEGEDFEYLWPQMRKLGADLVDEHFYRPEKWFLSQGNRYDNYDRKGPKVFAGEYACHGTGKKFNHFHASLLEAAFMTNLERNADVVHMATYAPLFAHVEGWQWRPDLIWFDNLNTVKSCSYYVQQLYSLNKGTNMVPLTMNKKPVSGQEGQDGLFASAVWDSNEHHYIVKVVNTSNKPQQLTISFNGLKKAQLSNGKVITFHSDNPDIDNSLETPDAVTPKESPISIENNILNTTIKAQTFAIYKFKK
ncbi:MAG: alpha-L-arabinofuranosidase C-terminal domain-containing protein [Phocaeicola sp.]|uniref:alpha-L-arabinofuranosidase C-terminal domain-containing protein n=1 Tax=Phocaeicola sp. TaxID=2773926 RepID=UPI003F9FDA4F